MNERYERDTKEEVVATTSWPLGKASLQAHASVYLTDSVAKCNQGIALSQQQIPSWLSDPPRPSFLLLLLLLLHGSLSFGPLPSILTLPSSLLLVMIYILRPGHPLRLPDRRRHLSQLGQEPVPPPPPHPRRIRLSAPSSPISPTLFTHSPSHTAPKSPRNTQQRRDVDISGGEKERKEDQDQGGKGAMHYGFGGRVEAGLEEGVEEGGHEGWGLRGGGGRRVR